MSRPLVEVSGLGKVYPPPPWPLRLWGRGAAAPRRALGAVSFELGEGEVLAVIGPNGAGKSSLLRILLGLLLPTEGWAKVGGRDVVRERPACRREVGAALSEDRGLSPRLTGRQNLRFFAALYGLSRAAADEGIQKWAPRMEAAHLLDRPVRTLSSGERARLVLVRALLHGPRVLLLDEVTRSLDPGAAKRLRTRVVAEIAGRGHGVLFASHDLEEVASIAHRVLLLDRGGVAAFGTFAEVQPAAAAVFARVEDPR